ncbi:hypothetical protein ABIE26_002186 [Pedobacter africanus]|uniref:Uncharacterized protein n=1 Tax=Pedobacter africanus TaxID=151894 RepID=A0ACC6KZ37_9SPHI|nr:DUF5689 domain-containing protein [Pedobacter africanus]MDR6784425.1 hypothetical protein [Pedobacter africanus]
MKRIEYKILGLLVAIIILAGCEKENTAAGLISPVVGVDFIRNLYNGDDVSLKSDVVMGATQVAGIVISDAASLNVAPGELLIQNVSKNKLAGISLDFGTASLNSYKPGDSVKVDLSGATLVRRKGKLQISGLNPAGITKVKSGVETIARTIALSDLFSNFQAYESTLIRINNAGIMPVPVAGDTFEGDKLLDDGTGGSIYLSTQSTASFAAESLPMNATFVGIATYFNATKDSNIGAKQLLRMRNENDVSNASGTIYAKFPEDFEAPAASEKAIFDMPATGNNVVLKSGSWNLHQCIFGAVRNSDRFDPRGNQCIRMQKNLSVPAFLQMNFDLPNGASKVTLVYGAYGTEPSSTWRLEYSQDAGASWKAAGEDVSDASAVAKSVTFNLNIKGNVRFRVNKLGLGVSNVPFLLNGLLNIDSFTVYQNID